MKYAKYGSAVVASFAVALALLVGSTPRVAQAANEASDSVQITRASEVAGAVTTYTVVFTNGAAAGANNVVLVAGDTITVDFAGTGATGDIQVLAATTVTVGTGITGCTGTTTVASGGDGNAAIVTLGAGCTVANDATGVTLTLGNIRNGKVSAAASLGSLSTNGATDDITATADGTTNATTAIGANFSVGIGTGAVVTSVSGLAGNAYLNVYPAATGGATTTTVTAGVFSNNNSASITCTDGTNACDADGTANGVISLVYVGGGSGTASFTINSSGLTLTRTLTIAGAATSISIVPTSTTMSSTAATTNTITVNVKDSAGNNVTDGTTVTLTTNLGTLAAPSQSTTATTTSGAATFTLTAQGVSGTATLTATVGTVSQTATVVLSGTTATITVKEEFDLDGTGAGTAFGTGGAPNNAQVTAAAGNVRISAALKDASGNIVGGVTPTISTTTSGVTFGACTSSSTVTGISTCPLTALPTATTALGSTVNYTVTVGTVTASGTFIIGGTAASTNVLTLEAADAAVASAQTVKVTVKTSTGLLVADGASVTLVASGGAIVNNTAVTRNGEATFTFIAPGTPQSVGLTAVMTVSGVNVTASKTIAVGAAAPAPTPGTGGSFSGGTIAPTGVSIVSFTGSLTELGTAGTAAKVVSVTATVGGKMITYVVGAPAFVNADFSAAFPTGLSGTLVIVKTGS